MFSVINAVLLEPFPYRDAGRITGFDIQPLKTGQGRGQHRMEEYLQILNQNGVFEDAIANTWEDLTLTGGREPEVVSGIAVSGNTSRSWESRRCSAEVLVRRMLPPERRRRQSRCWTSKCGSGALAATPAC